MVRKAGGAQSSRPSCSRLSTAANRFHPCRYRVSGRARRIDRQSLRTQAAWLGYYWSPTALLGKYEMVRLDPACRMTPRNGSAASPSRTARTRNRTLGRRIASSPGLQEVRRPGRPRSHELPQHARLDERHGQRSDGLDDGQSGEGEDGAKHFLKTNEAIWTKWVSPDAGKKIKAALQ